MPGDRRRATALEGSAFQIQTFKKKERNAEKVVVMTRDFYWDLIHGTDKDDPARHLAASVLNYGDEVVAVNLREGCPYHYFYPATVEATNLAVGVLHRFESCRKETDHILFTPVPESEFLRVDHETVFFAQRDGSTIGVSVDVFEQRKAGGLKSFDVLLDDDQTHSFLESRSQWIEKHGTHSSPPPVMP